MSDAKPQSPEKREFIARSKTFWNPGKTQAWQDMGVDLVIDRREGYFIWDMDGRRLIDLHLNGGTYNIGHRHPELIEVLSRGTQRFDMGNHHFPSQARTALAEKLAEICGGDHEDETGQRAQQSDDRQDRGAFARPQKVLTPPKRFQPFLLVHLASFTRDSLHRRAQRLAGGIDGKAGAQTAVHRDGVRRPVAEHGAFRIEVFALADRDVDAR